MNHEDLVDRLRWMAGDPRARVRRATAPNLLEGLALDLKETADYIEWTVPDLLTDAYDRGWLATRRRSHELPRSRRRRSP